MANDESNKFINKNTNKERLKDLLSCVLEHIVDTLTIQEMIDLMNMFIETSNLENDNEVKQNKELKQLIRNVVKYLQTKIIKSKPKSKGQKSIITGMVIFDGSSSKYKELVSDKEKDKDNGNLNVFVLKDGKWVPGEAEDKRDLESSIIDEYDIPDELNNNVGFIGFDKNQQDMVFKIKDTVNKRSTGFQCNQAGREKKHQKEKGIIYILNELEAHKLKRVEGEREEEEPVGPRFSNESTDSVTELCIRIEMTLRIYQKEKLDDKIWFLDTAKAIFNEFEKREKPVKK